MATRGGEGRVQNRRDADDNHVPSSVDRFLPVSDHGVVAPGIKSGVPFPRCLNEVVATNSQVHVHEALALGCGLPLLYKLLRQGAFGEKSESVPNAGVRNNGPASGGQGVGRNGVYCMERVRKDSKSRLGRRCCLNATDINRCTIKGR